MNDVTVKNRASHLLMAIGLSAVTALGISPACAADQPRPAGIPAGYVQLSPCVPGMGEHWANPATLAKGGTVYGVYHGKPIFTEIMMTQSDFASGKSWENVLAPLPGYHIDHVDIGFLAHGHPGMKFAHYDIHGYYVPHAEHLSYCGGKPAAMLGAPVRTASREARSPSAVGS